MSEAVTRNVRVHVESEFAPGRSNPAENKWFFLYTIRITNEGAETVQLLSRHWIITDAMGEVREIRAPASSASSRARAGRGASNTLGCDLTTPFGTMRGTYQMVTSEREDFEIEIPAFTLTEPYTTVH
jgi:ApaG protein